MLASPRTIIPRPTRWSRRRTLLPEWYFLLQFSPRATRHQFSASIFMSSVHSPRFIGAVLPLYVDRVKIPLLNQNVEMKVERAKFLVPAGIVLFLLGYICQLDGANGHKIITLPFGDIFCVDAKLGGVITMFGSILLLLILPWLDKHPLRSARYRPWFKIAVIKLLVVFAILGYIRAHRNRLMACSARSHWSISACWPPAIIAASSSSCCRSSASMRRAVTSRPESTKAVLKGVG